MPLQRFGYWSSVENSELPDACSYIDPSWSTTERDEVIRRLSVATNFGFSRGVSICQICGVFNGSQDHTADWTWMWPQGLLHYIEEHDLRPSEEFIQHVLSWPEELLTELSRYKEARQQIQSSLTSQAKFCQGGCSLIPAGDPRVSTGPFQFPKGACTYRGSNQLAGSCSKRSDQASLALLKEQALHVQNLQNLNIKVHRQVLDILQDYLDWYEARAA